MYEHKWTYKQVDGKYQVVCSGCGKYDSTQRTIEATNSRIQQLMDYDTSKQFSKMGTNRRRRLLKRIKRNNGPPTPP